jgi:hypothetical protein
MQWLIAMSALPLVLTPPGSTGKGHEFCPPGTSSEDAVHSGCLLNADNGGEDESPKPDHPPRPCHWVAMPFGLSWEDQDTLAVSTYFRLSNGGLGRTLADGTTQHGRRRVCTDDNSIGGIVWSNVTTLQDLINGATISASRKIPVPQLAVNPAPEHGGIVNFGMWLALGNPQPISVQAGIGNVWARTTAEITSTMWEMGNGDSVHCDGPGTPLTPDDPGWNDTAQGPCGYTYTEKPPPEPYHVTVTATWTVTWTTSTGTTGTANPITRSTTFDYDVGEIQTIGVSG